MEAFEPPKYLTSLIAAVNDGAKSAQLGALAFSAIGLFLLATAFSATDEDLLLNRALTISQLGGTAVPVVFAFGLAPTVFVAAHFYTLIRYDMLANNVRRFREDLMVMVPDKLDRERCRQLLANVEFVNAQAMPKGSRASSWMFDWTVWALLAGFPVVVLLLVQLQSLRLQNYLVNGTHHVCIAADLVLLIWFFGRLRGDDTWHFWAAPLRRKLALCWLPVVILAVDLSWLEVPGPDEVTVQYDIFEFAGYWNPSSKDPLLARWLRVFAALPVQPIDMLLCPRAHVGCRFLTVTNRVLVAKVWDATTFVALRAGAEADEKHRASFEPASLDNRTLRFADLTSSELFGASLTASDLQHATLRRATMKNAVLANAQLQGADLQEAQLQGADLQGAQLRGADLFKAQLQGADLRKAKLRNARSLGGAQLQGADLREVQLQGADLSGAQLQGADLRGAQLQGVNLGVEFPFAKLSGAKLQGAHLSKAQLQGAYLHGAWLQGADLSGAQLQGAVLLDVQLQGAVLFKAQLQGADLQGAALWNITTDDAEFGLADLQGTNFSPVKDLDGLLARLPTTTPEATKEWLRTKLVAKNKDEAEKLPPVNTKAGKIVVTNKDDAAWQLLDRDAQLTTDPADIDPALVKLLANKVAPTSPEVAQTVAFRVLNGVREDKQRPLIKLLGCRLQAQAAAKEVALHADTIDRLRQATGPCR